MKWNGFAYKLDKKFITFATYLDLMDKVMLTPFSFTILVLLSF